MPRYFNGKEVELLAPAGTFEIFKKVIYSGADAVYLGGKILNMRMHKKDHNLTKEELATAVNIAHSLNKKVYVVVNNLFSKKDLKEATDYLKFLESIKPDALIIQDLSILELTKKLNLNLNLHSSVMMNIHNIESIKALKDLGITRIVASREMDLKTVSSLSIKTNMEFEYFIHGDMCISHGGQCLYSGMLFGKSSNRGLCMKPCRWNFKIKKDGFLYNTEYPMAVKDMCMYEHIPELISSGIVSFKIEGRMRDSDYLIRLINYYSDAIDRYIDDPICFDNKKNSTEIFKNRKRDISTAYAFGKPGLNNINRRYEGTGVFYSHGKVFSNPIEEIETSKNRIDEIKKALSKDINKKSKPLLTVKVNSLKQAKIALKQNADVIYLSGEVFKPNKPFSKKEIIEITENKNNTKVYLGLPRMMFKDDFLKYTHLLNQNDLKLDGLLITNLGAIHKFKNLKLKLIGDYSLNIYNEMSAKFYKDQGLSRATLSVEAPLNDLIETTKNSPLPLELIVHGSPVVLYLEHDLYENIKENKPFSKEDNNYFNNDLLVLVDDKGYEHPVYKDNTGKNHILLYKDLCYLPFLKELNNIGLNHFRIEACDYNLEILEEIIHTYKIAIANLDKCNELYSSLKPIKKGFTLGALQFN